VRLLNEIYSYLCSLAPLELQMEFDNSGLLVGRRQAKIHKVLLALDITDEVIDEALAEKAELIVSHHPIIFHKLRSLSDEGADDSVLKLAENGLAAIRMHTNLDIAAGGVNDVLLALLGASGPESLDHEGCGRVGELSQPIPLSAFLRSVKSALHAQGLRYYDAGKPVSRLAVMGGAGGDYIMDAWEKGCDTYVTSDIKYHQFLDAARLGINLIDADHFYTENPVIPVLAGKLSQHFPDVEFQVSSRHHAVVSFF
jgi:dinuclear metal center YbgI/SA1388 family protein